MNKFRISERLSGLLAFALSALFYIVVVALILFLMKNRMVERPTFSPAPVNLNFAQIELKAAEPTPVVEPKPPAPEKVDVAVEEITVPPEPKSEPVKAEALVTQEASAPVVPPVDRNVLLDWVREQIEKKKYYPPAARNAGLEGTFQVLVKVETDGKISEATVLAGKGHPLLRRSLEKIITGLIGRNSGQLLPDPVELPFEFEFKLN